jgi:hypothetical protein
MTYALPTACSYHRQWYSAPSPHGDHSIGRATKTAVHAAAAHRLRGQSTSATGTAQTQWCDQDTGEASSIARAARQVPDARSPRHATAEVHRTARATGAATASQRTVGGGPSRRRVSAPSIDWLWARPGGPTRSGSSRPCVQYDAAGPGITTSPTTIVAANVRAARAAAARCPTRSSSTTKTSGVSFTPAATPTSTPDRRRSGRSRSTSTANIRSTLSCPNVTFCQTGSNTRAARHSTTTSPAPVGRRWDRRTTRTVPASAAADAPARSAAAHHGGTTASGAISTAANGG